MGVVYPMGNLSLRQRKLYLEPFWIKTVCLNCFLGKTHTLLATTTEAHRVELLRNSWQLQASGQVLEIRLARRAAIKSSRCWP